MFELIVTFIEIVLEIIGIPPSKKNINQKMKRLGDYEWFREMWADPDNRQLMKGNKKVRRTIGRIKIYRLSSPKYREKYQQKLERLMERYSR